MAVQTDRIGEVWEHIGHFVLCQSIIDSAIDQYTDRLPPALRKTLLKSVLRTEERHRALRAILDDRGLHRGYPDLPDLFKSVAERRNEIAHAFVTSDGHGGLWLTTWTKTSGGTISWRPTQVDEFIADERRLRGLAMTLGIELGVVHALVPGPTRAEMMTGPEAVGNYAPDEPRHPYDSEAFYQRRAATSPDDSASPPLGNLP